MNTKSNQNNEVSELRVNLGTTLAPRIGQLPARVKELRIEIEPMPRHGVKQP